MTAEMTPLPMALPRIPPPPVVPATFHTPAGFAPVVADRLAEHQINLTWASDSKQEQVNLCNCGWVGVRMRPEAFGSAQRLVAEYEGHLVDVGYIHPDQPTLW